ncbi:MAG: hypothetical protein HN348_06290 [Proteobacteria bacterium]|jgi:DnaK suppressor protein|nr:hypothetical protein [Pseudomonadota bacterium]
MDELTETQLAELLADLKRLKAELEDMLHESASRTTTVHLDQSAVGRVSRIDAIQQQKMAQAERTRAQARLIRVLQALKWAHDDEYGDCKLCGEPIGFKRLKARPESPFCVPCASKMEAR